MNEVKTTFDKNEEDSIFEITLKSIVDLPIGYERLDQINYLIKILDEKPGILLKALKHFKWLELRNVFSGELCFTEGSEAYMEHNEWCMWHNHPWEPIWKRFLVEVMALYEKWPKETQKHFRIMDTKEKWGRLRIDLSGYNDELHNLETAAELLSEVTCCACGKKPVNSRGEHLIYETKGWISYMCRDCFDYDWAGRIPTKKDRAYLKEYRRDCKKEIKTFKTQSYKDGKWETHKWVEKYNWLYKEGTC